MTQTENPYQAPETVIPVPDDARMPTVLKATIALYVVYCVSELAWMLTTSMRRAEMAAFVTVLNGSYGAFMCFALARRWQWARIIMIVTTFFAALGWWLLAARRGAWETNWPVMLSYSLRIVVGGLLFHPAIRHWFARRRA